MDYRHEWKHKITYGDLLDIRQRLKCIMLPDKHAPGGNDAPQMLILLAVSILVLAAGLLIACKFSGKR